MSETPHNPTGAARDFVAFRLGEQWFGWPVASVQEVLAGQTAARVPLAPPEVAGLANLKGHIVTVIDMHRLLQTGERPSCAPMSVIIRDGGELCAMLADEVGDVVTAMPQFIEPLPPTLDTSWRTSCQGMVRTPGGLMALLDPVRLLDDQDHSVIPTTTRSAV